MATDILLILQNIHQLEEKKNEKSFDQLFQYAKDYSNNIKIFSASCSSLRKFFEYYIKNDSFPISEKLLKKRLKTNVDTSDKLLHQIKMLHNKYSNFTSFLCYQIIYGVDNIIPITLNYLMDYVRMETYQQIFFDVTFPKFLITFFARYPPSTLSIDSFLDFLKYQDVLYFFFKKINYLVTNLNFLKKSLLEYGNDLLTVFICNLSKFLFQNFFTSLTNEYFLSQSHSSLIQTLSPPSIHINKKILQKLYYNLFLNFIKLPLPRNVFIEILDKIPHHILPLLPSPLVLTDFFIDSYKQGGDISILSLHGLYILISKHALDFPQFYHHLFRLLNTSLFILPYSNRFYQLIDLFLSSSHIPLYISASFAKRLASLSLHIPLGGTIICLKLLYNLLLRHPSLKVLVHQSPNIQIIDSFDYSIDNLDQIKTQALSTSLWEIQTLMFHYNEEVRLLCKSFQNNQGPKTPFPIEYSFFSDLISREITRKPKRLREKNQTKSQLYPVNYRKPLQLFPKGFLFTH